MKGSPGGSVQKPKLVQPKTTTKTREAPGLSEYTEEVVKFMFAQGDVRGVQGAIDAIVGASGGINPALLAGGRMKYDPQFEGADAKTAPDLTKYKKGDPVPVTIGPSALRDGETGEEYKPGQNKGRLPSIPWLYATILHEYEHVADLQRPSRKDRVIREFHIAGNEIISRSPATGVRNSPELMKHLFEKVMQPYANILNENWSKVNPSEKTTLRSLYEDAYKTTKTITDKAGLTLDYHPLPAK